MLIKYFLSFFFLLLFTSCKNYKPQKDIVIKAKIHNIPANKIYLAEGHQWTNFLDSSQYQNDSFSFHIRAGNNFTPFLITISYIDSNDRKIKTLYYRNHILSPPPDSTRYMTNFFVMEKGNIDIVGINNSNNQLDIIAGIETNAMFKTQMMDFGYVDNEKREIRTALIEKFKIVIKEYPSSYYLLGEVFNNKELYSALELNDYLNCFTKELQESKMADMLIAYIDGRPKVDSRLPVLSLLTDKNLEKPIIDTSSKLTMLVFWASWCAPCRAEIPVLKKLYENLKSKGFSISSISIDEDREKWKGAIKQEEMPWNQFIVDSSDIESIKKKYDFSSIPFTIISDKEGKSIVRSVGFDSRKSYQERRSFLDSLLKEYK